MKKSSKIQKFQKHLKRYYLVYLLFILLLVSCIFNIIFYTKDTTNIVLDENIVFFGDSITNKYNVNEFYPNHHVVNSGISGDRSDDLLERIEDDVYRFNPSKVFILIGINDLNHDYTQEEILDNIQKIVNGIKTNRPNALIYIESVYPINKDILSDFNEEVDNDTIKKFNDKLKLLSINNNTNYIDVSSHLVDESGSLKENYTYDGLHLNDLGYFKVTMAISKYVK